MEAQIQKIILETELPQGTDVSDLLEELHMIALEGILERLEDRIAQSPEAMARLDILLQEQAQLDEYTSWMKELVGAERSAMIQQEVLLMIHDYLILDEDEME